jgi:DNA polymerase elongation subunit (family B)
LGCEMKRLMVERDLHNDKDTRSVYQKRINALKVCQKPFREKRKELKKSKPSEWEDEDGNSVSGIMCSKRKYRFLKSTVSCGVIPTIIQNLLNSRKAVKKEMKTCAEKDRIVLDKKQLAYKVSANSMYGAMGVRRGYLPFMPGAMCVTYLGRELIKRAGQVACDKFGARWIYTDTDSTYLIFPHLSTAPEIWDYANHVAEQVSSEFPDAVNIEFEQAIYSKFIILSKKRYMYLTIDRQGTCDGKIGKKGIVLARRDTSGFLKTAYSSVIRMAFDNCGAQTIETFLIEYINDLFRNNVPYSQFVVTKAIGDTEGEAATKLGDYKVKALPTDATKRAEMLNGRTEREFLIASCPAQVQLAERMKLRGFPIDAGSRMEFVVLARGKRYYKVSQKVEDYDYFLKRKRQLKIDKLYYLESLVLPMDQLLGVVMHDTRFMAQQLSIRTAHCKMILQLKQTFAPIIIRQKTKQTIQKTK